MFIGCSLVGVAGGFILLCAAVFLGKLVSLLEWQEQTTLRSSCRLDGIVHLCEPEGLCGSRRQRRETHG